MFKKFSILISSFFLSLMLSPPAHAVCPVCVVAVGAGMGLSRWLGIDDAITGVWIGGLTAALIVWTLNWFEKKNWRFKGRTILTVVGYYVLVILPLGWTDLIGHPQNKLWGIDKLMIGVFLGSVSFMIGAAWYGEIKKKRGKAHFPFEKVAMPVAPLILISVLFYIITR